MASGSFAVVTFFHCCSTPFVSEPDPQTDQPTQLNEYEKSLANRKAAMLQEIHYDTERLDKIEDRLTSLSDLIGTFFQKVMEQGEVTEQSSSI